MTNKTPLRYKVKVSYDTWTESYMIPLPEGLEKELGWKLGQELKIILPASDNRELIISTRTEEEE